MDVIGSGVVPGICLCFLGALCSGHLWLKQGTVVVGGTGRVLFDDSGIRFVFEHFALTKAEKYYDTMDKRFTTGQPNNWMGTHQATSKQLHRLVLGLCGMDLVEHMVHTISNAQPAQRRRSICQSIQSQWNKSLQYL